MELEGCLSQPCKDIFGNLLETFRDRVCAILEFGLNHINELNSVFGDIEAWDRQRLAEFILRTLGTVGNNLTVLHLEPLIEHPELGGLAVRTIRDIKASLAAGSRGRSP